MPRIKTYRPIDEIMEIFKITLGTVSSIIKKYKIDSFSSKGKLQINAKDFYKAYTNNFNPSLFDVGNKRKEIKVVTDKSSTSDIFQKLFGGSYENNTRKRIVQNGLIVAKDYIF